MALSSYHLLIPFYFICSSKLIFMKLMFRLIYVSNISSSTALISIFLFFHSSLHFLLHYANEGAVLQNVSSACWSSGCRGRFSICLTVLVKRHHSRTKYCSNSMYASTLHVPGCVLAPPILSRALLWWLVWTSDSLLSQKAVRHKGRWRRRKFVGMLLASCSSASWPFTPYIPPQPHRFLFSFEIKRPNAALRGFHHNVHSLSLLLLSGPTASTARSIFSISSMFWFWFFFCCCAHRAERLRWTEKQKTIIFYIFGGNVDVFDVIKYASVPNTQWVHTSKYTSTYLVLRNA